MIKFLFLFLFVTSVHAAAPVPSCTPSRTSGVAPLAVFFDCTATTDADYTQGTGTGYLLSASAVQTATTISVDTGSGTILTNDYVSFAGDSNHYLVTSGVAAAGNMTIASPGIIPAAGIADNAAVTVQTNPNIFHSLRYRCSFGDPNSGKWSYGANTRQTKNQATGPVAAHVYETAGTYVWTCSVYDGTSTVLASGTITVTDISDANTYCISSNALPVAGSGGCPASATAVQQATWSTIVSTYMNTGKKVLLKRGDTWSDATTGTVPTGNGGVLGAYGTGAKPIITSSTSNVELLKFKSAGYDWRLMDIVFIETTATNTAKAITLGATATSKITLLRVDTYGFNQSVGMSLATSSEIAIVDSGFYDATATAGSNYGLYCSSCSYIAILGSKLAIGNTAGNHNFRLQGVNYFVISNNELWAGSSNSAFTIRGDSRYGIYSDNYAPNGGGAITPQNSSSNESQRDIIVERNYIKEIAGATVGPINISADSITIRNNIIVLTGASNKRAVTSGYINTAGSPMTQRVNIYNNTIYSSDADSASFRLAWFQSTLTAACNAIVKNNIGYSPLSTSVAWIKNDGSCVVTGAAGTMGNTADSTGNSVTTNPSFSSATPSNPEDFRIAADSYAYTTPGSAVPVTSTQDFYNCKAKDGTIYRGALVPKANMLCWAAK